MKLDWKEDPNVLYKFVFFGPIGKTRWPPLPLIGWDFYDFSSETTERNSTKLDRKQDFNFLYQVLCFLCRSEKQDGHPGLWLAEIFSTSPLKPLTEFNESWQEARCQRPLPILYFSGQSVNKIGGKLYSGARYVALLASYLFKLLCLTKDCWLEFSNLTAHMVNIVN